MYCKYHMKHPIGYPYKIGSDTTKFCQFFSYDMSGITIFLPLTNNHLPAPIPNPKF